MCATIQSGHNLLSYLWCVVTVIPWVTHGNSPFFDILMATLTPQAAGWQHTTTHATPPSNKVKMLVWLEIQSLAHADARLWTTTLWLYFCSTERILHYQHAVTHQGLRMIGGSCIAIMTEQDISRKFSFHFLCFVYFLRYYLGSAWAEEEHRTPKPHQRHQWGVRCLTMPI